MRQAMTSFPPRSTSSRLSAEPADPAKRAEQARAVCLRLLTARARTRAELVGQLAKRGYPDDVSTEVIERLSEVGLVDDEDFAEQWVRLYGPVQEAAPQDSSSATPKAASQSLHRFLGLQPAGS